MFFACGKNRKMECAWIRNCHSCLVALCILILNVLEMRLSPVFILRIFKLFYRCHLWPSLAPSLAPPCLLFTRGKLFRWHVVDCNLSSISCNFVSPYRCALRDAPQSCFLTSEKTILTSASWVFNFFSRESVGWD